MDKIYRGAGRLNPIWEQGAGKWQKLEGSRKKDKKGAGRMIKNKKGAGRQDPPLERLHDKQGVHMGGSRCKSITDYKTLLVFTLSLGSTL